MAQLEFDLLIIGAGPAGCTLALHLAGKGLRIGIIEKDVFPRKKICGDALSGKVLSVLKRIPGGVHEDFIKNTPKVPSYGIRFVAPNSHEIDVPFLLHRDDDQPAPGYLCKREDFDNFLSGKLHAHPDITVFEGEKVLKVARQPEFIIVTTEHHEFRGKMIAGADGVHSVVRNSLHDVSAGKNHLCVGIRGYFEHVTGLHPGNYIELIFLKRLVPGYFWIFPSTGGLVNAGFGMMQGRISRRGLSLAKILDEIITSDPLISPRFANAIPVGKPGAHSLPLGSFSLRRSGDRYILLGDAAFMVDPFSGEGIGNAMASGEIAADILERNFKSGDFSAVALQPYDERIRSRFSQEFRTMSIMQRLAGSAMLFNMVVDKARKNKDVSELLTAMFTDGNVRKKLTGPGFYAGLLFR